MKKQNLIIIIAMMFVMVGCVREYEDIEEEMTAQRREVISSDSQSPLIISDTVFMADGYDVIDLPDTIDAECESIDLSDAYVVRKSIVDRSTVFSDTGVVTQLTYELTLKFKTIEFNIRVIRQVVSDMELKDGIQNLPFFSVSLSGSIIGFEPMETFTESHSRTYFVINAEVCTVFCQIGAFRSRISFYTANRSVGFYAGVGDWDIVN